MANKDLGLFNVGPTTNVLVTYAMTSLKYSTPVIDVKADVQTVCSCQVNEHFNFIKLFSTFIYLVNQRNILSQLAYIALLRLHWSHIHIMLTCISYFSKNWSSLSCRVSDISRSKANFPKNQSLINSLEKYLGVWINAGLLLVSWYILFLTVD